MQTNLAIISQKYQAMRAQLMTKIGAVMLRFTDDRFREQGWNNEILTPWERRKNNTNPGRSILIKSGALRRGNRIVSTTDHSITMGNDVPYAKAHNDGFNGMVTVKSHTRKRLSKTSVTRQSPGGKPRKATVLKSIGDIEVKSFTRNMNMPERRFMGNSATLRKQIKDLVTEDVKTIFK